MTNAAVKTSLAALVAAGARAFAVLPARALPGADPGLAARQLAGAEKVWCGPYGCRYWGGYGYGYGRPRYWGGYGYPGYWRGYGWRPRYYGGWGGGYGWGGNPWGGGWGW